MPPRTPTAERPYMPGYGIAGPDDGRMLPWEWARERLAASRNYWVSTTRPTGRPHAMPVWGVWMDNGLAFSTSAQSVKARNFQARPDCVITTESGVEAVIVEGAVGLLAEKAVDPFLAAYEAKYDFVMGREYGPFYVVRPRVAFGFIETDGEFQQTATRWRFA